MKLQNELNIGSINTHTPIDFQDCKAMESTRRRKLANNTYLIIRNDGGYGIKLHNTEVVIHYPNSLILHDGNYQTVTTKERINRFSRAHVWSDKGVWMVDWHTHSYPYADDMELFVDGHVTGQGKHPNATKKLRKRIDQFSKDYAAAFIAGNVPKPGPGDCWGCLMVDKNNNTAMGSSHILTHINEKYYVPSMLNRMMSSKTEHFGYVDHMFSPMDKDYIDRTWSPNHEQPDNDWGAMTQRRIYKAIRKFCFHELGLAA